ncbi:hypothetical protein Tco_0727693 [Tanacetum coccineum]|uniref:Uncharacterized protein n=1 Tax=Tanacetum coccineum TaxID=301880 RepID=A0ABQ4YLJ5_9ASTR
MQLIQKLRDDRKRMKKVFEDMSGRVISSISASGSKPLGTTKKNRTSRPTSSNKKNKVEDHRRSVKSSFNRKNRVSKPVCNANVMHSVLNVNYELVCSTCNECMFDAIHDLCIFDYLNNVNKREKSRSAKSNKKKNWKLTGKVFTGVEYRWLPTGRSFTIDRTKCSMTRIASTLIVPPKETSQTLDLGLLTTRNPMKIGDTIGIKSLLEVTAPKLLLLVLKVNAAGIKVTTAERLQLLKG